MMFYSVEVFAASDHLKLQQQFNAWLRYERPKKIISVEFVADGAEFTYCVLVLYLKSKKTD
jgi:hypothetical protein